MKDRITDRRGTTLVELTVAVAILATVMAAIVPLLVGIRNSMDSRWAGLERVQNARVLNEQLCRCLAGAQRIVAVGDRRCDDGHIEFEAADGRVYRCALGAGGWVEYGPVGSMQPLAGPVEYLRFACTDGREVVHSMSDPNDACLVTWEAGFQSSGGHTAARAVAGACYLRTGRLRTPASAPRTDGGPRIAENRWRSRNHPLSIIHHP
jgi:hypothetical protein